MSDEAAKWRAKMLRVTPEMVLAGLRVRLEPHMRWESDETRLIAEYRAMVKALDNDTA